MPARTTRGALRGELLAIGLAKQLIGAGTRFKDDFTAEAIEGRETGEANREGKLPICIAKPRVALDFPKQNWAQRQGLPGDDATTAFATGSSSKQRHRGGNSSPNPQID